MFKHCVRASALPSLALCCSLFIGCSPDDGEPSEEVQRFGAEEDIKVDIQITPIPSSASENGDAALFEVSINEEPLDDLLLRFTSRDLDEVESSAIIFSGANWGIPQELALRGVDDTLLDGDQQVTVEVDIITLDERYAALSLDPLVVENLDNEDPDWVGIGTTSPTTGDTGSGGSGGSGGNGGNGGNGGMMTPPAVPGSPSAPHLTFEDGRETLISFTSNQEHSHPIRVSLQIDDDTEGRITTIRHATDSSISNDTETSFTFAPERWPETWNVTLRGIDDNQADGNIPYTMTMQVTYEDPDIDATITQQVHLLSIDGVCGNGILESNEECDDGNTEVDGCAYGEECCNVCGPSCFEVEGTPGGSCGDGIIQGDEVCDPASPKEMCNESPFSGGVSSCEQNCQMLDTSRCFMDDPPRMHLATNRAMMCQNYGDRISCAGRDSSQQFFDPPAEPEIKDMALDNFGGCLIDQFADIKCWGYPNDPFDYVDEGDVVDIDMSSGRLCAAMANGAVYCWAGGPVSKIITQGLSRTAKPLEVVLDDEDFGDYCVRFDDQSMDCGQTHVGDATAKRPFSDVNAEIVEIAIDGQWTCALSDGGELVCNNGVSNALTFQNVHAFHLDQEICLIDTSGVLSCPSNSLYLDNFAGQFNIDVREGLEDVVFNEDVFCVLRQDRTTRCWGDELTLDQALVPLPWEGGVENYFPSFGGILVKNSNTSWRANGRDNLGQSQLNGLEQIEALGQQYGLRQVEWHEGIACGLFDTGELSCPNTPLPRPSASSPHSRIIPVSTGPFALVVVNAAREIERHSFGQNFPLVEAGLASYFTGVARPPAAANHNGICVGGANAFTTCVTGNMGIDNDPPDFLSDLALSFNRACGIRAGSLLCWGNTFGPTPTLATYLVQVEIDDIETCVRDSAGEVWCWYPNETPTRALPGSGYSDFKLADGTKCGLLRDELICRGSYVFGGVR
jgi:hypothetical protein